MAREQAHIWPAELCRCCYGNYSNNVQLNAEQYRGILRTTWITRRLFITIKRSIYYRNTQAIWLTACVNFTIDLTSASTSSSYIEFSGVSLTGTACKRPQPSWRRHWTQCQWTPPWWLRTLGGSCSTLYSIVFYAVNVCIKRFLF